MKSLILMCCIFASTDATPWYVAKARSQGDYFVDSEGYYHKAVEKENKLQSSSMASAMVTQKTAKSLCQSAFQGEAYVHICQNGTAGQDYDDFCLNSNSRPCCTTANLSPIPLEEYKFILNPSLSAILRFYSTAGVLGSCYVVGENNLIFGSCTGCSDPTCAEPRCIQNTLTGDESSCSASRCECKVGYAGDDCCECDLEGENGQHHYEDPVTGKCIPFCASNCPERTINGCTRCSNGFDPPDCCNCTDGRYLTEEDVCEEPECKTNVESCTNGVCTCEPGYLPNDCCKCAPNYQLGEDETCTKPECEKNVIECTNGVCTCEPGYLPNDCCDCAPDYQLGEDETCTKPECEKNVESCTNGVCICKPGYLLYDCCECAPGYQFNEEDKTCTKPECEKNVNRCIDGECTCRDGYLPNDCCLCKDGYYLDQEDKECKKPCPNIESCTGGVCTCKDGYGGDDCCSQSCSPSQDIYFLIDTTSSYREQSFCKLHYGTQLMISALLPTASITTGTRLGVILYPTLKGDKKTIAELRNVRPRIAPNFMNIGVDCNKAINEVEALIDGVYKEKRNIAGNPRQIYIGSRLTFPATAFETLNREVSNVGDPDRRRAVIVFTDGPNDDDKNILNEQIETLKKFDPDIEILAAGLLGRNPEKLRSELQEIASEKDNVIANSDPIVLARNLIKRLINTNIICKSQGEIILREFEDSSDAPSSYCTCRSNRVNSLTVRTCRKTCSADDEECDAPRWCQGASSSESLEEEILAAVEEVLKERMETFN